MRNTNNKIDNKGFSLIELLIVGSIISITFVAISTFLLFSRDATLKTKRNTEAIALAEEAIEALRKLRDDSWTSNIATLNVDTTYYPVISGNQWTFSTTNPSPSSYYTTTIVLHAVTRDANDNISGSGTTDADTRQVVATVSWNDSGPKNVDLTAYITNFNDN